MGTFPTVAPIITENPLSLQVLEGDIATFTCLALAEPMPIFQWMFEDMLLTSNDKYKIRSISSDSSLLVINDISVSDIGEYTCVVMNEHGNDSATAEMQVLGELVDVTLYVCQCKCCHQNNSLLSAVVPIVEVSGNVEMIGVRGEEITLRFYITRALPVVTPDNIQWFFVPIDGAMMEIVPDSDPHYSFSEELLSLYIYPLLPADEGNYTLVATNTGGSGSGTIILDVQSKFVHMLCQLYCISSLTICGR